MRNELIHSTYIAPRTSVVTLQGVRGVMDGDGPIGPGLATSPSHSQGQAPARVPARKLYI